MKQYLTTKLFGVIRIESVEEVAKHFSEKILEI